MEQTSSSLTPWFAVTELKPYIPAFAKVTDKRIKTAIQKGANRLLSMQTDDGGLAYWPGGNYSEDWATSIGGHTLILAKLNGAEVPQKAIDGICNYLTQNLHTLAERNSSWDKQSAARSLYTLALAGKVKQSDLNYLFDRREKLGSSARLYLALAMHLHEPSNTQVKELLETEKKEKKEKHWMRFSTDRQLQLLAYTKIDPESEKIHQIVEAIVAKASGRRNHWGNTWANASTVNAMAAYAKLIKKNKKSTTFTVTVNGETETRTLDHDNPMKTLSFPLAENIDIKASSDGLGYSNAVVYSKPELVSATPTSNNGVAIDKKYFRVKPDGSREPLKQPKVGDLVEVELEVTFSNSIHYVVIDDPLPGTFECVNSEFASQSTHVRGTADRSWTVSHQELRDDRALFFLNRSWRNGPQKLSYLARITSSGTVTVPAAKVEAMYDPETYGLTPTTTFHCEAR